MATEENIEKKADDNIAKLSENRESSKLGFSKFLDSHRFVKAKLDEKSTTTTSFPILDADGMKTSLFQKNLPIIKIANF